MRRLGARLLFAVLLAGTVAVILIAVDGHSPMEALRAFIAGTVGSATAIGEGLDRATPYCLAGIGVALCFRAGIINIGAEGQIALGGLAAAEAAIALGPGHGVVAIPLALAASAVAGAFWAVLATALHLARGVHEVLVTLLGNFVALLLVQLLLAGPWGESGAGFLETPPIPRDARLPLIPGTATHAGLLLAIGLAGGLSFLLWRTPFGFGLRILGQSRAASLYAGDRTAVLTLSAMSIAGAVAGLAGGTEMLGLHRRLVEGFSLGFGFRAVTVALIGVLEPLAVLPASLLVGCLETGGSAMQRATGVPAAVVLVVEALAVLAVLAASARRIRA